MISKPPKPHGIKQALMPNQPKSSLMKTLSGALPPLMQALGAAAPNAAPPQPQAGQQPPL